MKQQPLMSLTIRGFILKEMQPLNKKQAFLTLPPASAHSLSFLLKRATGNNRTFYTLFNINSSMLRYVIRLFRRKQPPSAYCISNLTSSLS